MKLFFKNGVYASLSLSRIFNTLGASILPSLSAFSAAWPDKFWEFGS